MIQKEKPWDSAVSLAWCMPLTWPYINKTTHLSLMAIDRPSFIYLDASRGGDIAEKREFQVEEGMKLGCTHFFLLDADMVYPENTLVELFQLLKEGADLAGGLCYRGAEPYDPLVWSMTEDHKMLKPFQDFKMGDIIESRQTGAACLLVKREVFEKVPRPWFRFTIEEKTMNGITQVIKRGEDTYFTSRATEAGFKLMINTTFDIGHLREFAVDRHFYITYGILNQLGSWDKAIRLFGKLKDKDWIEREFPTIQNINKEDTL